MMCSWRLIAALAGLCASARIRQDMKMKVLQGGSANHSAKTYGCPVPVQESDDLNCRDADGNQLALHCCDLLKTCRRESTMLLAYALEWNSAYEQECGALFSDFDFAPNMMGLVFVGNSDKLCTQGCQGSARLSGKTPFQHSVAGLQEMCDGMVVASEWQPQLESAMWPMNKVDLMDEIFEDCGPGRPAPVPTPAPPATTTTTTRTVSLTAPWKDGVDFSFMTGDITPEEGQKGIMAWLNKLISKRRQRNDDAIEEIAQGHTCRTLGATRDQTYYASSLCYWLPDIKKEIAQEHVGLDWNGGRAGMIGQPLCEGVLSGKEGKCMKCSVCHDNAMNQEGEVTYTSFIEEVALDANCKKETDIETLCVDEFHRVNQTLRDENERCVGLKEGYENAVARHEQAEALVQELTYSVETELPAKIYAKERAIEDLQERKDDARADEQASRSLITSACYNHASNNGWPFWFYRADDPSYPTSELLDQMRVIVCVHPGLYNPTGPYRDCLACKEKYDATKMAFDEYEEAQGLIEEYQRHIAELQARLDRKTDDLAHWTEQLALLAIIRQEKTDAWEEDYCENLFTDYDNEKKSFVRSCAVDHYDDSCEKACIEVQNAGCGVMEGTMPSSSTGRGGLRNTCRPPQHSWIHGPWNYDAATEDAFDQCSRVWRLQAPSYAQDVKKAGWLQKAGRYGGWWFGLRKYTWERRYFVFESGDQVRSAIMRYFLTDPNTDAQAEERHNKFIIVWDAKRTQVQSGSKYRRNGDACFELVHFYRTYIFCISEGNKEQDRNDWVDVINPEIRFPSK